MGEQLFLTFVYGLLFLVPIILLSSTLKGKQRPLGLFVGLIVTFTFLTLILHAFPFVIFYYIAIAIVFFAGVYFVSAQKLKIKKPRSTGFVRGCIWGLVFGIIWTPIAGLYLDSIPTIIYFVLIIAIPLFLIIIGCKKIIQKFFPKKEKKIQKIAGLILIFASLVFVINAFIPKQPKVKERAPDIKTAQEWINSPPLALNYLRGKVVLLDFWHYSCDKCIKSIAQLEQLQATYRYKGLLVVGIHTPEYEFEKERENVLGAVKRLGIKYPIALDNDKIINQAFQNDHSPSIYLIDQKGQIVSKQYDNYLALENQIRALFKMSPLEKSESNSLKEVSPKVILSSVPKDLKLKGKWNVEQECIVSESDESKLDYHFQGKQAYLVLSGDNQTPLSIYLDGVLINQIVVNGSRMYTLANSAYGNHVISLKVPKGIKAYALSFGNE